MKQLGRDYARAFVDCSTWLARWCPPWRWVLGVHRACAELRAEVTAAGP